MEQRKLAKFFAILADQTRLRIITLLLEGELCVCEIQQELEMSQPSVSYHLRLMERTGYLLSRQSKGWTNYRINPQLNRMIIRKLKQIGLVVEKQV